MRALRVTTLALLACGVAAVLGVACTAAPANSLGQIPQSQKQTDSDTIEMPPPTPRGGACNLQASGLKFATAACDACMQGKCCQETVRCVVDDPKCAELQKCLLACPASPARDAGAGGDGGGKGDGGSRGNRQGGGNGHGGGNGQGGGASACESACNAKYPAQVTQQAQYNDCVTSRCGEECM